MFFRLRIIRNFVVEPAVHERFVHDVQKPSRFPVREIDDVSTDGSWNGRD